MELSSEKKLKIKKYLKLSLIIGACISFILVLIFIWHARVSRTPSVGDTYGPEYIIPLSVHADAENFTMRVIVRDCNAGSVIMNLKKNDNIIASVRREISVTKQQGINLTLEPDEIMENIPHDVVAELILYAKANADDKLNNDPIDKAVVRFKNYTVQLSADSVYCVADAMTLDEKAQLVAGMKYNYERASAENAAGRTNSFEKYGIPSISLAFGTSGVSAGGKTSVYPSASVIANTWNTALAEKTGASIGSDAKHFNVDMLIVPGLNIRGDMSAGAGCELFSENPILTGYIGSAFINGVQSQGVEAAAGKFVLGTQNTGTKKANTSETENISISEKKLREIYLSGFEIAVNNSYPYALYTCDEKINGVYAASDDRLISSMLRNEWGYGGVVIYENTDDSENMITKASEADLLLSESEDSSSSQSSLLVKSVKDGVISESQLEAACVNILRAIVTSNTYNGKNGGILDTESGAAVSKEVAAEGIVLLKNENNALPASGKNVAVFGNAQIYTITKSGLGYEPEAIYEINFLQGLENAGFNADQTLKGIYSHVKNGTNISGAQYASGTDDGADITPSDDEIFISEEAAARAAEDNNFAVICISRETVSDGDNDGYSLSENERILIKNVSEAFHAAQKTVTVIINSGNPIETVSWEEEADAILYTGIAGMETGSAAAEIISGSINPSGKLSAAFAVPYSEPAYAFGYGLSYTTFEYSDINVSSNIYTDSISVTLNVKNTGERAGKEIVQLYVKKPDQEIGSGKDAGDGSMYGESSETVLASFVKTDIIEPGMSQRVTLVINNYSMRSYSEDEAEWYIADGVYTAYAAPSVKDTGSELLRFSFTVEDRISVKAAARLN